MNVTHNNYVNVNILSSQFSFSKVTEKTKSNREVLTPCDG